MPKEAIDFEPIARPNTSALAATTGLADPVVKEALAKALQRQVEENNQRLVQQSNTDDPGQYFPQMENEDDGGYSAPLGLKDESHNDWMK